MKHTLALLVIATLLAGCANTKFGRADLAERAKVELVGKSRKDILMCAGVPVRSQQAENLKFMTYYSGGDSDAYVAGEAGSSTGGGAVSVKKRYCKVTFILSGGVVEKVNYAGRTGGFITEGEQCAFVLQNCLPK
ncbi:hypothetical protein [Nitrosococcus watsonii]|uniref:Lipoprotein n=1 Tax=Nitrosococcus watsoni (strain C-113) TaxID=105559 RepID=D8K866_NITWC|nr:hypothetical protein [Nitrosococcus watsonii]ADJ27061.1 conserved hypothetical protein [Nitrosococcus watsonii C-113]